MPNNLFGGTINLLERTLDLRSQRHNVINSNIANEETPGYKAVDIDFKAALQNAEVKSLPLIKNNERHFGNSSTLSEGEVYVQKTGIDEGYDENSVNIEMEMAKMMENTMMYNVAADILARKFRGLEYAVREGR